MLNDSFTYNLYKYIYISLIAILIDMFQKKNNFQNQKLCNDVYMNQEMYFIYSLFINV